MTLLSERSQNVSHRPRSLSQSDTERTLMCDNPVKDIQEAKARLVALFGDLETYIEFLMKQQKKRMKQSVKYVDYSEHRKGKTEKHLT